MTREFFNSYSPTWDENNSEKDAVKLERLVQRFDILPGSSLLDVGTGTGVLLPFLVPKCGRVIALDYAEGMLRRAKAKDFKGNISYLIADVQSIPLAGGVFEAVVCYSSFPHFHDKLKALTELHRVISDGGRLFICHTSSREEIHQVHCQVPCLMHDFIPERGEMERLLSSAGFGDIHVEENADGYFACARKV